MPDKPMLRIVVISDPFSEEIGGTKTPAALPFKIPDTKKKVSEKDAFFFCYAARLLSIFIFKTSLVFSIISFGKVILQK